MSEPVRALAIHEDRPLTNPVLPLEGVREMVAYVQQCTSQIMVEGEDYGEIPGVQNKILMQPGAQKLGLAFQLRPEYQEQVENHGSGHRTYDFKVTLIHRGSGQPVGEGVGSCSTLESKYRYRWDSTGRPVPQEYWDARDSELLGGPQFRPRKSGGKWQVFQQVEHPDPADYYNTCRKMAKKRAYVDAMITATACSHLFTQDLEENAHASSSEQPPQRPMPAAARDPGPEYHYDDGAPHDNPEPADYYQDTDRQRRDPPRASSGRSGGRGRSGGGRPGNLSEKQIKRAWAIAKSAGAPNPDHLIRQWQIDNGCVNSDGEPSFHAMTKQQYDELCDVYLPNWEASAAENDNRRDGDGFDDDIPF